MSLADDPKQRASRRAAKKAVNVSLDADLSAEAKAAGLNLSGVMDRALRDQLKAHRTAQWQEENRESIESSNAELERNGLWSDPYRLW